MKVKLALFLFKIYKSMIAICQEFWFFIELTTEHFYGINDEFNDEFQSNIIDQTVKLLFSEKSLQILNFKNDIFTENYTCITIPGQSLTGKFKCKIISGDSEYSIITISDKEILKSNSLSPRKTYFYGLPSSPHSVGVSKINIILESLIDGNKYEHLFIEDEVITLNKIKTD